MKDRLIDIRLVDATPSQLNWLVAQIVAREQRYKDLPVYFRSYDDKPSVPHWGVSGSSEEFQPTTRGDHGLPILEVEKILPKWDILWKKWTLPDPKNAALGILGESILGVSMLYLVLREMGNKVDVPLEWPAISLEKCPFCNGKTSIRQPEALPLTDNFQVFCQDCGASSRFFPRRELAAQAWNAR